LACGDIIKDDDNLGNIMDREYLKEKIIHERNVKDNFWLAFMATLGGSLGLLFNVDNIFKFLFALFGFFISYILFNAYFVRLSKIKALLNLIKKGESL
jgi:hypothetical protein